MSKESGDAVNGEMSCASKRYSLMSKASSSIITLKSVCSSEESTHKNGTRPGTWSCHLAKWRRVALVSLPLWLEQISDSKIFPSGKYTRAQCGISTDTLCDLNPAHERIARGHDQSGHGDGLCVVPSTSPVRPVLDCAYHCQGCSP